MMREDLLYSIGEIDEKFVSEAERPYFGLMPKIMKYGSIAASLLLVMTVSFFLIFHVFFGVNGEDGMGGDADYSDGADGGSGNMSGGSGNTTGSPIENVLYADCGSLAILEQDAGSITLSLRLVESVSKIDVRLLLNRGGEEFVLTTEESLEGTQGYIGKPAITVNGSPCDVLPTEVGSYTVTVDFRGEMLSGYSLTLITVTPFGDFE